MPPLAAPPIPILYFWENKFLGVLIKITECHTRTTEFKSLKVGPRNPWIWNSGPGRATHSSWAQTGGCQGDWERRREEAEGLGIQDLGPAQGSFTLAHLISRSMVAYPLLQRRTPKLRRAAPCSRSSSGPVIEAAQVFLQVHVKC